MKKYIAKTDVSINIVLPGGANRHISFSALTGGGSVFYTDDPDLINGIERHYKYGKLFRTDPKYVSEKPHNKPASKPKAEITPKAVPTETSPGPIAAYDPVDAEEVSEAGESAEAEEADESEQPDRGEAGSEPVAGGTDNGLKTIVVSDPDAAKAYLAEHFGISRTKIKSIKAIKEAAVVNGIVFEGLE